MAAGLVPGPADGLISPAFNPAFELKVAFNGRDVTLGNLFRSSECKSAPAINFSSDVHTELDKSYLIMLVDPDAPTPDDPKFAFWRHWIQSGLQPPREDAPCVTFSQAALTEYLGPGPKDDSKPHRYLFLLFREPSGFHLQKEDVGGEEFVQRRSFNAVEFIKTHHLELVGLNWMLGAGDGWQEQDLLTHHGSV
ncbi:phosphatidylethanolamine-binding protein [Thelonectria olida]|uniref:Phosphatidylethanolamine-binding protein n=1 Tax=Thelonectria olida TaxID=1576542 RepID=A0A9P9AMZ3_9HYPO|nr:phosphatidylethanolamine-binding protein [Thelonectria olida]